MRLPWCEIRLFWIFQKCLSNLHGKNAQIGVIAHKFYENAKSYPFRKI